MVFMVTVPQRAPAPDIGIHHKWVGMAYGIAGHEAMITVVPGTSL